MLGDKSGLYFDVDGWGYMRDVEFINYCVEHYSDKTATFRLEGVLDYHSQGKEEKNYVNKKFNCSRKNEGRKEGI